MKPNHPSPLLAALLLGFVAVSAQAGLHNPWAAAATPFPGEASPIGGYAGGCIQGAVSLLPDEGDTFQLMRKSRRRYYTHPNMRAFVGKLAGEIKQRHFGTLLVGDLSQARGGPTTTGHSSHQTGLDADFWFWFDSPASERPLQAAEVENLSAISMLNPDQTGVDPQRFQAKHQAILEFVSGQAEVARIFVHPRVKQALCERTNQAAWLNKVRPWWGHHYHFHVRLNCPAGHKACKPQPVPPDSHGCGAELQWWFSAEAAEQARKSAEESSKLTPEQRLAQKLSRVPAQCRRLLEP